MSTEITLTVNGDVYPVVVDEHASLLHTVRDQVGLTGPKEGCGHGECGACMVVLNGRTVNSCLVLAAEVDGELPDAVEGDAPRHRVSGAGGRWRWRWR